MSATTSIPDLLTPYQGYLLVLATSCLHGPLRARIEPADLVQQVLLKACRMWPAFKARNHTALLAWLREILNNEVRDQLKHQYCEKRDLRREGPLVAAADQSSLALEQLLQLSQTSPSGAAVRDEELLRLADAIAQLPLDQQQAVIAKHLQGKSLEEVATELGKSVAAVAGLLRRGLAKLREILDP